KEMGEVPCHLRCSTRLRLQRPRPTNSDVAGVLIVDDDAEVAATLLDVVRAEGHEARIAQDGREGLKQLGVDPPDVLLLDVEMPELTGPEVAYEMLLRDCGLERVPVVLISGIFDLPSVAAIVGTPYFLTKPFGIDELVALVKRALRERKAPRPRRQGTE